MAGDEEFLKGLAELTAALREIAPTVQKNAERTGLFRAAQLLRDRLKATAPISSGDPPKGGRFRQYIPGTLKSSFKARRRRGSRTEVAAGVTGVFYAKFVEFGHTLKGHRPDKTVSGHVPANAFIRRAFEGSQQEAIDEVKRGIVESIQKRIKKLNGTRR